MRVLEAFGEPILHGGQESFVVNALQHMDRSGLTFDMLTPYYCRNEYYRELIRSYGGEIYELQCKFNPGQIRMNIIKPFENFLGKHMYDVIHIHSGSTSMLGIMSFLAKKHGIKKVIVHSHSAPEKITLKNKILRSVFGMVMKDNVDTYCACSPMAGSAKFTEVVVSKVLKIIPNGVDISKFHFDVSVRNKYREELHFDKNDFVLGHVGRFSVEKNHTFLIDIFADVLKQCPNAKLLLIGEGDLELPIKEKVKSIGITDRVVFTGAVNNVYDYMQAMDCFVFPSIHEGLPVVLVEAQASGLPCIISESCPKEVALTPDVRFCSLFGGTSIWCQSIMQYAIKPVQGRKDNSALLIRSGYDIINTSKILRQLYID